MDDGARSHDRRVHRREEEHRSLVYERGRASLAVKHGIEQAARDLRAFDMPNVEHTPTTAIKNAIATLTSALESAGRRDAIAQALAIIKRMETDT